MKVKVDNIVSEIYQEIKKSNVIQLKIVTEDLKEWANRKCSKKFLDALIKKLNVMIICCFVVRVYTVYIIS